MTDLIERELSLPGTPAQLWTALTDPEWLSCWLADEVALELRPGGEAGSIRFGHPAAAVPRPAHGGQ